MSWPDLGPAPAFMAGLALTYVFLAILIHAFGAPARPRRPGRGHLVPRVLRPRKGEPVTLLLALLFAAMALQMLPWMSLDAPVFIVLTAALWAFCLYYLESFAPDVTQDHDRDSDD